MRFALLSLFLVLVGCGDPMQDPTLNHYQVDCLGRIFSRMNLSAERLKWNAVAVRKAFVSQGLMTDDQFCEAFSHQDIYIEDKGKPDWGDGVTDVLGNIWLTRDTVTLPHELLHVWENQHGKRIPSTFHAGWDENGNNAAIRTYGLTYVFPFEPQN